MATPSRARQQFGAQLRALRIRATLSVQDVVDELRSTTSTVTRQESGHHLAPWPTVIALLALYNATKAEKIEISRLWTIANNEPPPMRLPAGTSGAFRRLLVAERDGKAECTLATVAIPGLLQTEEYAKAIFAPSLKYTDGKDSHLRGFVSRRIDRQRRLEGSNPLILNAVIDEGVLRRMVGGPVVMSRQLDHLLTMGSHSHITIRIVPLVVGAYGTMSGSFTIITYDDGKAALFIENAADAGWIENAPDVQQFTGMYDDIVRNSTLNPADTVELIRTISQQLKEES